MELTTRFWGSEHVTVKFNHQGTTVENDMRIGDTEYNEFIEHLRSVVDELEYRKKEFIDKVIAKSTT